MKMLKRLFLLWLNFFLTRYNYSNKILAKHPFFSGTLRICQNTGIILYEISNNILSIIKVAAAVAQWVRLFAPQAEVWASNPSRDRPMSLKQVVTAPLPNARH